jgi:DNA-binding HxlR family transcriptional regulator
MTQAATLDPAVADRSTWRMDLCPISRSLEIVGTRTAMLIIREAYYGTTRFDDFAARVGMTQAVAAARLRELTEAGLLRRQPYREPGQRTRHEYVLTEMGRDLAPAVFGLYEWGSKYLSGSGRGPLSFRHDECGSPIHVRVQCEQGHDVELQDVAVGRPR